MFDEPAEQFYAQIYLKHINDAIRTLQQDRKLSILDLGCGHGRLAIPLAAIGHKVTALDSNEVALARARKHAAQQGVSVEFRLGDLWSERLGSYDVLLAIESLDVTREKLERFLSIGRGHLVKGGLMIFSLRTRYYQTTLLLKAGDYEGALTANSATGKANCGQSEELGAILLSAGYEVHSIVGVGVVSGLEFDPFGGIANPAVLPFQKRRILEQIELSLGALNEVAGCARYLLVIARARG